MVVGIGGKKFHLNAGISYQNLAARMLAALFVAPEEGNTLATLGGKLQRCGQANTGCTPRNHYCAFSNGFGFANGFNAHKSNPEFSLL
jgi:predicted ATP-grasp superfamily ATP-dependent carboligase